MKIYEVWEWDGTSLNGRPWKVGVFTGREAAEACVAELQNDWNSRRITVVQVQ